MARGNHDSSKRNWGLADDVICCACVNYFGHARHPIDENALKSGLESDGRCRTRHTGADEFNRHEAGLFVDIVQENIAVIGLNGRADDFDDLLYLFTHNNSRWNRSPSATL